MVLTYRFWTTVLKSDPGVLGKTVRLDSRTATIVGVLEPSVPYPAETEIIANVVTSPHHLSATMVTGRVHRMTELFGRLAPGADLEQARAELKALHGSMVKAHPEAYSPKADFRIDAVRLRDQITSRARTILLVLMAASVLVFVIACSNVANLILARTVRREGELGIRAALGASVANLRRTLLAESLILCGAGAALGVLSARPMVAILARYASRILGPCAGSDHRLQHAVGWGVAGDRRGRAPGICSAVAVGGCIAWIRDLKQQPPDQQQHSAPAAGLRDHPDRRVVCAAGGGQHVAQDVARVASGADRFRYASCARLERAGNELRAHSRTGQRVFNKETIRRISELPGVDRVAVGTVVPWRDAGTFGPGFEFSADGHVRAAGEEDPRGRFRTVSPGFFAALGVPIIAGRDFNDADRKGTELVAIVSQSLAQRMFPNQDAVNRHIMWTDPVMKFIDVSPAPRRIVGVVADVDDENVVPGPALTVYHPFEQEIGGGRLFVHARANPYALVTPITQIVRQMSADQIVERAATLEDVRAEVLTPNRLNTIVFGGFAAVALAIAVVGVAGVLAFSVSGRTREFGIRLAIGSQPSHLLAGVIAEGAIMAGAGIVAGAISGYALASLANSYFQQVQMPDAIPVVGSALVLLTAAVVASVLPAARAARVDVMQALRSE